MHQSTSLALSSHDDSLWAINKTNFDNVNSQHFPLQIDLTNNIPQEKDFRRTKGFCQKFIDSEYKNREFFGGSMFKCRDPTQKIKPIAMLRYSSNKSNISNIVNPLIITQVAARHLDRTTFYNQLNQDIDKKLQAGLNSKIAAKTKLPSIKRITSTEQPESDYSQRVHKLKLDCKLEQEESTFE